MIRYVLAFTALSLPAIAGDNTIKSPTYNQAVSNVAIASTITAKNSVRNNVSNKQGQVQEAAANNSGVNVTNERAIIAPSLGGFASGPCTGIGAQASVGVAGFGGGVGFTALDNECTRRETARVLHLLGQTDAAIQLMMAAPILQGITPPKKTTEVPTADTSDYCARNKTDYYCQPKS